MFLKNCLTVLSILCTASGFAQDFAIENPEIKSEVEVKVSYLDSIKATFVKDELASRVDSLWMKELTSLDIYEDLTKDIQTFNTTKDIDYELPTDLLKQRLEAMNEKSPFEIQYNQGLENIIKSFLKNRKKSFSRLMALSEYYFPIFEEAFARHNVPLEIKYLAVVESALNPKAVSKMGATGLWQFMYGTGKQYNLKIDSFLDERSEVLKATTAASQYLSKMFTLFGDWELVLASYNSGPGNVTKAIRRSGGKTNYWEIRNHLPKETQGYVPAFLATMYLFEYRKEHGIIPDRAVVKHFETDTIRVRQKITFKQLADVLDITQAEIALLNPSYKLNVVPYYSNEQHFIRLPKDKIATFISNEEKIYAYVQRDSNIKKLPDFLAKKLDVRSGIASANTHKNTKAIVGSGTYKVKKGDNLHAIASKYNVSVANLKQWNNIKGNALAFGTTLRIKSELAVDTSKAIPEIPKKVTEESAIASVEDQNKPNAENLYTVKAGDNLGTIAKKFGVSIVDLKEWNDLETNNIALGKNLIVAQIDEAQPIVDNNVAAVNPIDSYKKKQLEAKSVGEDYYVKKGDSLYSISKKYPGITISDIKKWNGIKNEDLKPGMKLKING